VGRTRNLKLPCSCGAQQGFSYFPLLELTYLIIILARNWKLSSILNKLIILCQWIVVSVFWVAVGCDASSGRQRPYKAYKEGFPPPHSSSFPQTHTRTLHQRGKQNPSSLSNPFTSIQLQNAILYPQIQCPLQEDGQRLGIYRVPSVLHARCAWRTLLELRRNELRTSMSSSFETVSNC
jgi:hypothetical protein